MADNGTGVVTLGDFAILRGQAGRWHVDFGGEVVVTVDKAVALAICRREYDPAALARGELRPAMRD